MELKHNSITEVEDNNVKPHLHKTQCCVQPFSCRTDAVSELYNMDCIQGMKHYPDGYFDLAIVDPPYGIGMSNSNKRTKPSRPNSYTQYADFRYHETNWDDERPPYEYFTELFRVSKNQIIWGANYLCEFLPSGFGWIFWNKLNGLENCFSDGEFAFTSKGIQSKYFECSTFHNLKGGKDRIHPTQKPVKLYDWILKNYAEKGQKILDTHVGSGSSRIACYQNGFDFVGFEIDKIYCEKSDKYFVNAISQQRLSF
jgi:site-specific DNA-methyltransferase (adenine-specific)